MPKKNGFALDGAGGERLRFSDAEFVIRASSDSTKGAFTIIEEVNPLDTPLHVHRYEDELFYVLEGEHVFRCGEEEFRVGPGGTVFAPRGIPHAHRRVMPRTGRFLTLTYPAGFERFFRDLAEAESSGAPMAEAYASVAEKFGVTWL
jgi:mannose-6-phosphate isomerase-like protein (cupin superfamily)